MVESLFVLCACVVGVGACTAVTEALLEPDAGVGGFDGATSGGGSTTHGAAGRGGLDVLACGERDAEASGECPQACTGGCDADTCVVACEGSDACDDDHIVCPDGWHCSVRCVGEKSCHRTELDCPERGACSVICDGVEACKSATMVAHFGPFTLQCSASNACDKTRVSCGPNICEASCDGGPLPSIDCGDACVCQPCIAPPDDD